MYEACRQAFSSKSDVHQAGDGHDFDVRVALGVDEALKV